VKFEEFKAKWSPHVGSKGAAYQYAATRLIGFGGIGVVVWGLLLGYAISSHNYALKLTSYVLMGIDGAAILAGLFALSKAAKAMSSFLGMRISMLQTPSLKDEAFKRWCSENGIDPSGDTRT
jgi:hypothetical protein